MKVHFLGGSDEVGASCILVEMGGQRILVDAGIRVSPKARDGLSGELLPDLSPLNNSKLDAIIITHAHADHIGAVPLVVGSMMDVPVYTTPATISLMSVMFRDALRIMDSRMEADGELPTYDLLQVQKVENNTRTVDFKQEFSINGAVNVTFYRAGHIPGAASVYLQSDDGSILISGDLSFSPMRATPIAEIPPVRPDVLLLETTYGGKLHASRRAEESRLVDSIREVIENGGRVLIPAFALGRAQEVALILDSAIAAKKLPNINVYMDGMTRSITQVFERFPDYLSKGLQKHLEENLNIFRTNNIQYVKSVAERQQIIERTDPYVVISSSGMLTGGASPLYAQSLVKDQRSAIFITGYQDEESPGRALQHLANHTSKSIVLYGKRFEVNCKVETYSLSAHADENEITQYAVQLEPRSIYLVHGDGMARERIRDLLRMRKLYVHLPTIGDEIDVTGTEPVARKQITEMPSALVAPITSLEEIDIGLPIFNADGFLYVRNAKKAIRKVFPVDSALRKMSFNKNDQVIKLSFDFPDTAKERFAEQIQKVQQIIGWQVEINDSVNMNALHILARDMLADVMIGRASIHMVQRVVEVRLKRVPEDFLTIQKEFKEETGFRLVTKASRQQESPSLGKPILAGTVSGVPQMEINDAYSYLKHLFSNRGLYKAGFKGGRIVLSFITPDAGMRYEEEIQAASQKTGYPLAIHPHPNQHQLIEFVNELCMLHNIVLVKNPSIMLSDKKLIMEYDDDVDEASLEAISQVFQEETAWELEYKKMMY